MHLEAFKRWCYGIKKWEEGRRLPQGMMDEMYQRLIDHGSMQAYRDMAVEGRLTPGFEDRLDRMERSIEKLAEQLHHVEEQLTVPEEVEDD